MVDASLVKLDPVRLAGLETYLSALADGCRRGAGSITDELAGTEESGADEITELNRIAEWCRWQHEDIVRRRTFIERMPAALPLPDLSFGSRAEAIDEANRIAGLLRALLQAGRPPTMTIPVAGPDGELRMASLRVGRGEPPDWPALHMLLAEVARGMHSPTFSAQILRRLGPRLARELPVLVQRSWASAHAGSASPDRDPHSMMVVQSVLRSGLSLEGEHGLSDRWARSFAGLDGDEPAGGWRPSPELERRFKDAGFAKDIALNLSRAYRAGRLTATRLKGPGVFAVIGLAEDVVDIARDPSVVNVLDGAAGMLAAIAPFTGPAAPFVYVASSLVSLLAWCQSLAQPGDDRSTRTYNPDTGVTAYPSGSQWNPHVDEAGVPLPP